MIKDPKVKDPNSKIKEFIQMIKIKNSKLRYLNVHESKIKKKKKKKKKKLLEIRPYVSYRAENLHAEMFFHVSWGLE